MSENTDRFGCFFRQLSTPYIDFDLCLQPENQKAPGEEFIVHLYIDTEDQSLGLGDVRYAQDKNDCFDDHCFTADELSYFRQYLVNEPTATQLANRIAHLIQENAPQNALMAPSAQSVMELLNHCVFPDNLADAPVARH